MVITCSTKAKTRQIPTHTPWRSSLPDVTSSVPLKLCGSKPWEAELRTAQSYWKPSDDVTAMCAEMPLGSIMAAKEDHGPAQTP